jgi:hypothetical protein
LSKQAVLNLLDGADPKLSTLHKLADALRVEPSDLLEPGAPPPALAEADQGKREKALTAAAEVKNYLMRSPLMRIGVNNPFRDYAFQEVMRWLRTTLKRKDRPIDARDAEESGRAPPKPGGRKSKGRGIRLANEALNHLTRIPRDDEFRERGLEIVSDWIERNR